MQRFIHKYDLKKRAIAKKLGVWQNIRARRIAWARSKITWTVAENWSKIIFSDEMAVTVNVVGFSKSRKRRKREKCLFKCIGHLNVTFERDGLGLYYLSSSVVIDFRRWNYGQLEIHQRIRWELVASHSQIATHVSGWQCTTLCLKDD